jgi:glycosyltransferase involved in cell wall biosynthesis
MGRASLNAKPTKVLFLEHNIDGTVGGSHFCLLEICRHINRHKFAPVVWFFQENSLVESFRKTGADVIVKRPPASVRFHGNPGTVYGRAVMIGQSAANLLRVLFWNRTWWENQLRAINVGLVHLNNSALADLDLQLACLRLGIPCVAHQRGYPAERDWLTVRVARRLKAVIAISNSVRDDMVGNRLRPSQLKLIFDGIDPERIESIPPASDLSLESFGIPAGSRLIGIAGNVKRWKGQLVVAQAMAQLHAKFPDLKCLMVGAVADSEYSSEIVQFCEAAGIQDAVRFAGYQQSPLALMARMDIVLHASIQPEPFGIVVLEAMALGRPVIATRAGGPMDIVEDGRSGLLVAPGDASEMAAAIELLLESDAERRRIGAAGRARVRAHFSARLNAEKLQTVYDTLLER